jgi:hypothetical protein
MRYLFAIICLAVSSIAHANTYNGCKVENAFTNEALPNLVTVTLNCTAPDAATTAANCVGAIKSNGFIFDSSTVTGKSHMALVLVALVGGNNIFATTYGSCSPVATDSLWLYSLRLYKP